MSDLGFFEPQLAQEDTRNEGDIEIEEIENFAPALLDEEEELLNDPDFAELLLSSKNSKEILGEIRKESRKIGLVDGQAMQANLKSVKLMLGTLQSILLLLLRKISFFFFFFFSHSFAGLVGRTKRLLHAAAESSQFRRLSRQSS